MTSDARGREGVGQNLMISDEGGRGGPAKSDVRCEKTTFFHNSKNLSKKKRFLFCFLFIQMTKNCLMLFSKFFETGMT